MNSGGFTLAEYKRAHANSEIVKINKTAMSSVAFYQKNKQ